MKGRWVILALTVAIVVLLATGVAFAARGGAQSKAPTSGAQQGTREWMDQMHNSPMMRQMRGSMPADMQKLCDQTHASMDRWLDEHPGQSPMMGNAPGGMPMMGDAQGGMGMMGGRGMMGR